MKKSIKTLILLATLSAPMIAYAQSTVECHSVNYKYNECQAPLRKPQLIHQISSSSCILNRTWGFNPTTRRVWVAQGCSGVFADVSGYHYGRGDNYDRSARYYDDRGHDAGAVTAGVVLGAVLEAAASDSHRSHSYTTSNNYYIRSGADSSSGYTGCHGVGCLVDDPDKRDTSQDIDPRPSFDKQGNPNFDTQGNWQGCHGVGCDVDPPESDSKTDDESSDNN
ncbi:MAG: DUF3011 domain-containing protein [Pseudoxanthomonas sp.]